MTEWKKLIRWGIRDGIDILKDIYQPAKLFCKVRGIRYLLVGCGFDIETTRKHDKSYMYHWQLSIGESVVLGRTWNQFILTLEYIKDMLNLNKDERLLMYIANMGFEWQFIRKRVNVTNCMFKDYRHPIMLEIGGWLEIRDALAITGTSLKELAKAYTKTQKMDGDLDYTKERSYLDTLTEKEEQYCINDVVILKEFSEYIFNEYGQQKFLPLTKTGILRWIVKTKCKADYDFKKITYFIRTLFPDTQDEYEFIMRFLFAGGITHGMALYQDEILDDIDSWDIKSSYPAVEVSQSYPMSPFKEFDSKHFKNYIKKYHVIFVATFKNVKTTTNHSIFSLHKCIDISNNKRIDNGRVYECEYMKVFLTEVDYINFSRFYKYDKEFDIEYCAYAKKGKLPDYLILPQIDAYIKKEELSKKGLKKSSEYANQKSYVNSGFGMCVTRMKFIDFVVENNGDVKTKDGRSYYSQCLGQILSPFWGIYITAWARKRLLDFVWLTKDHSYYQDTDGDKIKSGIYDDIIKAYNQQIERDVIKGCKYYNIDYKKVSGLGQFQKEYHLKRFKFLGAKRYLVEYDDGKIESTVSGLKKEAFIDYVKDMQKDAFDLFENNTVIPSKYSPKKVALYCDEYTEDYINGVLMSEESCVTISESDLSTRIDKDYMELIETLKEKVERGVIV